MFCFCTCRDIVTIYGLKRRIRAFGRCPNYCFSVLICEFDISIIGQVAKQETGHALGLGHANFDGTLLAETVNDGTATVPECEINAVATGRRMIGSWEKTSMLTLIQVIQEMTVLHVKGNLERRFTGR